MSRNTKMGASRKHNDVLMVLHPRRPPEIYRKPITAGEIMKKHPRYCIARPDVFQFPWIVVHPNSVLVPGKVFYLVPYSTLDKLMKKKRQQLASLLSPENNKSLTKFNHPYLDYVKQNSPTKALAGITPPKKQLNGRYPGRQLHDDEYYYTEEAPREQESDTGNLYKEEFYKSWDTLRKNLQKAHENGDQPYAGLDSPLDIDMSYVRPRPRVESPEQELVNLKPCLRKADSERKKLSLKVSFVSAVMIPGSRRGSPSDEQGALVLKK